MGPSETICGMEMSFDRMLGLGGIGLGVLGIVIGIGVAIAMDPKSRGELIFSIGCFAFSGLILLGTVGAWAVTTDTSMPKRTLFFSCLFVVIGISLVQASRWAISRHRSVESESGEAKTKPQPNEQPPTLTDLFSKDFSNTMKVTNDIELKKPGAPNFKAKRQIYLDFEAKAEFIGYYIPSSGEFSNDGYQVCLALVNDIQPAISGLPKQVEISGGYRDESTTIQDLTFSGRVLLYHSDFLSIVQKAEIIKAYKARNLDVQFRGPDYLADAVIAWHHQHDPKR